MPSDPLPEPWHSFLRELDTQLAGPTELHCLGGFVVAQCYGLMRPTADIDILESRGADLRTIAKLAGRNSPLHKRHGVYIDVVTVADVPDNYGERLTTAFDAAFEKLRFRISNGTTCPHSLRWSAGSFTASVELAWVGAKTPVES
jgi:hypothetical protein